MTTGKSYGSVNGHLIGIAMKEMVRRALEVIRDERFIFEAHRKQGHTGELDDVVTTADAAAQRIYVKLIREQFPTFGILAEEDALRVECTDPTLGDVYFTVDPLDGTRAYERRQSHGIGTMIALVQHDECIAAYVGDVMTREIYGYRPESDRVYRISEYGHAEHLRIHADRALCDQWVLLRKRPEDHSPLFRRVLAPRREGGLACDVEITAGSIGISMARLWKGEVGAAVVATHHDTPWDSTPVIGICKKLGFVFLEADRAAKRLVRTERRPLNEVEHRAREWLVVHESRLGEVEAWQGAGAAADGLGAAEGRA
jgi:fructose-1,6-bisphosphatase/inositol monophosphatase family enzyme